MTAHLRNALLQAARSLGESGLSFGRSGNLSLRCGEGFLVTPSGIAYDRLQAAQLVHVNAEGHWQGDIAPSSEWPMHLALYRARPDLNALVHAHSRHATALACTRQGIPPFHYMVSAAGGHDIRCCGYALFGSEALAEEVVEAMQNRKACLMANHGQISGGVDIDSALHLAGEVENLAAQYILARQAGNVVLLSEAEMTVVIERFRRYGQVKTGCC